MNDAKYIGLDVHQATISVAVLDSAGKPQTDGKCELPLFCIWRGERAE
jgi:hypothetical protein